MAKSWTFTSLKDFLQIRAQWSQHHSKSYEWDTKINCTTLETWHYVLFTNMVVQFEETGLSKENFCKKSKWNIEFDQYFWQDKASWNIRRLSVIFMMQ